MPLALADDGGTATSDRAAKARQMVFVVMARPSANRFDFSAILSIRGLFDDLPVTFEQLTPAAAWIVSEIPPVA